MKRKKYIQSCETGGFIYGRKKAKRTTALNHKKANKKDLADVYNKFFKDQVSALYRAINNS